MTSSSTTNVTQAQLKELEAKRWRQQSDLLRARDSKVKTIRTTEDRLAQLEEAERLAKERAEREMAVQLARAAR